jgi:hypothetical protein
LYDISSDPHETKNLAGSAEHAAVLKELRGVLEQWIDESNDQGRELEPSEIAAAEGRTKPLSHNPGEKRKKAKAAKGAN